MVCRILFEVILQECSISSIGETVDDPFIDVIIVSKEIMLEMN